MVADRLELAVIIPCKDGLPFLRELLDSLVLQRPAFGWEVIIADNGCADKSIEVSKTYRSVLPIRILDATARRGQSYARNIAAHSSRAAYLLFVDQDDVLASDYVVRMHAELVRFAFAAATLDSVSLNPRWAVEARFGTTSGTLGDGLFPRAPGTTLGVDHSLFDKVGGFDESIIGAAEDTDLCWRIQRDTGTKLVLTDKAVLKYRLKPTLMAMFCQGRAYGRASPVFYKKWRSEGFERLPGRAVARRWASSVKGTLAGANRAERARGLYLLGVNLGRLESSIRYRTLCL